MERLDFNYFFEELKSGAKIDETNFALADDSEYDDCYLGFLPQFEKPYWYGLVADGSQAFEFQTAEELVNAKVFHGKSLAEVWDSVTIYSIYGLGLDDWLKVFRHSDT